jgi:hypothetical protein
MTVKRKAIPIDIKKTLLHESGYKCSNPNCRTILTIEMHHLDQVSNGGTNSADNLIALCPNCHTQHHGGQIPIESLRAWKVTLMSLNNSYDAQSVDLLLAIDKLHSITVSGDGVLKCASLLASGLISADGFLSQVGYWRHIEGYVLKPTERGQLFLNEWKSGAAGIHI